MTADQWGIWWPENLLDETTGELYFPHEPNSPDGAVLTRDRYGCPYDGADHPDHDWCAPPQPTVEERVRAIVAGWPR